MQDYSQKKVPDAPTRADLEDGFDRAGIRVARLEGLLRNRVGEDSELANMVHAALTIISSAEQLYLEMY